MKRLLSVFGVLALAFALTAAFSVPEKALAGGTKNKPKVDGEVEYYLDENNDRVAIKNFTIDPYTYYNICKGEKLSKRNLKSIVEQHVFPRWGVIAEGIFRDQANQLVTIEGSGMMSSDKNASESFDRHFSYGKSGVSSGYSGYSWSLSNLAEMLGYDKTGGKGNAELTDFKIIQGSTNNDEVVSSGIQPINNLNDARTLMGRSLRACADDNDLTVDDFLGNGKDKSGNEYRLPAINDDKTRGGYVNIVTCNNRAGSSGDYDYVSFGIAVYDLDVTPIAADNLSYISAADKFDDENPIKAAYAAKTPGVTYSDNAESSDKTTYYLMKNLTPQEATTTTTLESSVSEENSVSLEETEEFGMEQEIGVEVQWGGDQDKLSFAPSKVAIHANQGWHETWSTMRGNSQTKSRTTTKSVSTEMPLPGHTAAAIAQDTDNTNWEVPYGQPVVLSYKVAIFAMSGDYYNGWGGLISSSRYDKQWMSVLFEGSDSTEVSGCHALSSLYSRAVDNANVESYDGVKGKYRTWCDKGAWKESKKINWDNVASSLAEDNRSTHSITNTKGKKSTLKDLASEMPMAEMAAVLNEKSTAVTSTIKLFLALHPLNNVAIEKGNKAYDLTSSSMYLDGIELEGYNRFNVPFYGFDQGWGQWTLLDSSGKEVVPTPNQGNDASISERQKIQTDDGTIELITYKSGSQQIKKEGFKNITSDKTFNLKWKINPESYSEIKWNGMDDEKTHDPEELTDDLEEHSNLEIDTPTLSINIPSTTKDVESITVTGSYEGAFDESVNLSKELNVDVKDHSGTSINVPIFWQDQSASGTRYVEENGDTKFPTPGEYKVRAYTINGENTINSNWFTVKAKEKAALTSIALEKPDYDEADLTLTKEYPTRSFNIASMVRYYDQFGNSWKGTDEDPTPKLAYSVRQVKGAAGNPEFDNKGMLTVSGEGIYEISAEISEDETRDAYKNITINPIRINITQEDWLDEIVMTDPSIDKNELNLKDTKTPVTISNLKQYLEFYDQQGEEWEGKKPVVKFVILGETEGAEIKGSNSTGYDFYAYSPGRYTIQPIANDYNINPIFIYVGEDRELTIKTNDPPQLALSMDVGSVSVDLNRFVDYTTQFGGKWTGTEPVLDFKLDADVTGARIDNGEVSQFSADKAGRYYVHVTPRKASEYEKKIDDIVIDVTKKREIHFVALDFDGVGMDDRVIGEDGKYTLAGLSKYLTYADGELEEFTANEIANYRYPMPKITGYTVSKVDEEGKEQTGGTDPAWKIIEADGDYTFETQEPGIYLIIPTIQTPEGKENNKVATIGGGIVVLPEGMDKTFGEMVGQIASIISDEYLGYDEETKAAWRKFEEFIKDIPNLSGDQAISQGNNLMNDLKNSSPMRKAAIEELKNYKDPEDYRSEQKLELDNAIKEGTNNIKLATDADAVANALKSAKEKIDGIKTDDQLTAEELAEAKTKAKEELAAYKDPEDYRDAQKTELSEAINAGNEEIDAAKDKDAVAAALEKALDSIDKIKTDEEITAEEKAAEEAAKEEAEKKVAEELAAAKTEAKKELAEYKDPAAYRDAQKTELSEAINAGNEEIDAAKDKDAVADALDKAKANIDKIKTDTEITAEEKTAKEEADKEAADNAGSKINALPAGITTKDEGAIREARAAYNALTEDQKKKVDPAVLKKLEDAEKALEEAKKAEEEAAKKAEEEAAKKAEEEAKKAAEEKAANAKGADGTAYGKGAGAKAVDKAITSRKSDADPKGAKIAPLLLQSKSQGKNSIKLTWKKVSGAKKYVVYGNACGKNNKMKKLATKAVNNMNVKKIAKKLKTKTYHKFMVVALDKDNKVVSTSAVIHVATKGNLKKAANPKKVVVKAKVNAKGKKINTLKALSKTVVKKGKKVTLKASITKAKKTKVVKHSAIRFMSSNTKIATVSKKGVVKGIKKGTATIYAYAQNGTYKAIKVTVK